MEKSGLIEKLREFFKEKAENYGIGMVFLFGSWAKGFPRKDSDLDIAVYFMPEKDSEDEEFLLITDLSFHLSQVFKKEMNIISIHGDFRKPMLYYNAIILGEPLYINNIENYISLHNEAIFQMEDFCIFGARWQLDVAKHNMEELKSA